MSKSGQTFVAKTEGTQFTLYAMCKAMGISLSKEQEEFQAYLEKTYPPVIEKESKNAGRDQKETSQMG